MIEIMKLLVYCMKNTCMTLIALIFCRVVNQAINYLSELMFSVDKENNTPALSPFSRKVLCFFGKVSYQLACDSCKLPNDFIP